MLPSINTGSEIKLHDSSYIVEGVHSMAKRGRRETYYVLSDKLGNTSYISSLDLEKALKDTKTRAY